ncbi:MAG: DUF4469 domain-containing protein [Tannerellaceae bacterium]|jgi:hypothetical protein|nr:DUF4469 domain-containing protein [Tannerellaceae bacterium]
MSKNYIWKIWLRLNPLNRSVENDYIADTSTFGRTAHNEEVARCIVKGRSEMRYETILSILNERDTVVRDILLSGSSVQDGNVYLAPRITGTWTGLSQTYDPQLHKTTVDAYPTSSLRRALRAVGVDILGRKNCGGALIGLVTDVRTGDTGGNVSAGGEIIIEGRKIMVVPAREEGLGVFFAPVDGGQAIPLDAPPALNTPRRIICRIPAQVTAGAYMLQIVTRYSNSSVRLKYPRTLEYELPLTIHALHSAPQPAE